MNITFLPASERGEQDLDLAVYGTADFIKKVLLVYTHSMLTIYLSLSAQVALVSN